MLIRPPGGHLESSKSHCRSLIFLALVWVQRRQCFSKSPGDLIAQPVSVITVSIFTKAARTGTGLDLIKSWLPRMLNSGGQPQSEARPLRAH